MKKIILSIAVIGISVSVSAGPIDLARRVLEDLRIVKPAASVVIDSRIILKKIDREFIRTRNTVDKQAKKGTILNNWASEPIADIDLGVGKINLSMFATVENRAIQTELHLVTDLKDEALLLKIEQVMDAQAVRNQNGISRIEVPADASQLGSVKYKIKNLLKIVEHEEMKTIDTTTQVLVE